jgi:hypothetical protein
LDNSFLLALDLCNLATKADCLEHQKVVSIPISGPVETGFNLVDNSVNGFHEKSSLIFGCQGGRI